MTPKQAINKTKHIKNVDERMGAINKLLEGYGIEAISDSTAWRDYWCNIVALYVNMGDTYIPTVVYDVKRGKFMSISWGDYIEKMQPHMMEG